MNKQYREFCAPRVDQKLTASACPPSSKAPVKSDVPPSSRKKAPAPTTRRVGGKDAVNDNKKPRFYKPSFDTSIPSGEIIQRRSGPSETDISGGIQRVSISKAPSAPPPMVKDNPAPLRSGRERSPSGSSGSVYPPVSMGRPTVEAHPLLGEEAKGYLTSHQTDAVSSLIDQPFEIVSKNNSISFTISSRELLERLYKHMKSKRMCHLLARNGIRLVGSGAACILQEADAFGFDPQTCVNDLDFSIYVSDEVKFHEILQLEEEVIAEIIAEQQQGRFLSLRDVYDLFFLDSLKVNVETPRESWSLITIGKKGSKTIDIKFVQASKRSFAFSVDSFEIVLDNLFFPRSNAGDGLLVESLYGRYEEAVEHLRSNTLSTIHPEEIRRGIFRYCYELSKGRKPKTDDDRITLDRVFTNAFFAETNMPFEDVLSKFLLKHNSNGISFLLELHRMFTQCDSCHQEEAKKYVTVVEKLQTLGNVSSLSPLPALRSNPMTEMVI